MKKVIGIVLATGVLVSIGWGGREQVDRLAPGPVDPLLEQREEQAVLAREVPVERALGIAGSLRDLVDRCVAVAALGEDLDRRVEQCLAAVAALGPGRARAPVNAADCAGLRQGCDSIC